MSLFTKPFLAATAERAIKTAAQTAVALLSTGAVGVLDVDWLGALSATGLATVLSVLTSIGSATAGGTDGPSLIGAEELPPVTPDAGSDISFEGDDV